MFAAWLAMPAAQTPATEPALDDAASFRVDKATLRAGGASAALIDRVSARALRYFRLLARTSSARTCSEFRDLRWRLPAVAVHGDAHLEQFVVTRQSYGLEDFDMSGFGPAVVDLVRYAASLHVACRDMRVGLRRRRGGRGLLRAYREAARSPGRAHAAGRGPAPPRLGPAGAGDVARWADHLMTPLPAAEEASLRAGWGRFIDLMLETRPESAGASIGSSGSAASRWVSAAPSNRRRSWRGSPARPPARTTT